MGEFYNILHFTEGKSTKENPFLPGKSNSRWRLVPADCLVVAAIFFRVGFTVPAKPG